MRAAIVLAGALADRRYRSDKRTAIAENAGSGRRASSHYRAINYVLNAIRESRVGRNWKVHHIPNGINSNHFTPRQNFGKKLKLLVVNRNFKDPQKGFETIKDALSRIDQKEFEVTLVGSNSDWAAKDLKGEIGVRNLEYLYDREALARL